MVKKVIFLAVLAFAIVGLARTVQAQPAPRVTICHRTNSVTNPYNKITVSANSVDGEGKNDHTHHTGPIATSEAVAQALKDSKTKWGDIIPPVEGVTDGLNWPAGQAMFDNDCNFVVTQPPTEPPTEPETPGQTLGTSEQATAPVGGVGAGVGGAAASPASYLGLGASLSALGVGALRFFKRD